MIIGIIGAMGSGKDTAASYLIKDYGFEKESFAKSLKDATANIFGWPRSLLEGDTKESREWREVVDPWWAEKLGIPDFTPRRALQLLGTNTIRENLHPDIWLLSVIKRINSNPDKNVVITDVRFKNEVQEMRKAGATIVLVERGPRPEYFEIAKAANAGDQSALDIMTIKYSHIHRSEWDWIGSEVDYVLSNNGTLEDLEQTIKEFAGKVIR